MSYQALHINSDYRFGFNGQEKDNEIKGIGNSLDFGARIYDSRSGKFLSLDPLAKDYPNETNYGFAGSSPIGMIDLNGERKTVYTIIINEMLGNSTSTKMVTSAGLMPGPLKYIGRGTQSFYGADNYEVSWYDYEVFNITIIKKDGTTRSTTQTRRVGDAKTSTSGVSSEAALNEGYAKLKTLDYFDDGGGLYETTKGGGGDATNARKGNGKEEHLDIDALARDLGTVTPMVDAAIDKATGYNSKVVYEECLDCNLPIKNGQNHLLHSRVRKDKDGKVLDTIKTEVSNGGADIRQKRYPVK